MSASSRRLEGCNLTMKLLRLPSLHEGLGVRETSSARYGLRPVRRVDNRCPMV
jgi:hypothetical protein